MCLKFSHNFPQHLLTPNVMNAKVAQLEFSGCRHHLPCICGYKLLYYDRFSCLIKVLTQKKKKNHKNLNSKSFKIERILSQKKC